MHTPGQNETEEKTVEQEDGQSHLQPFSALNPFAECGIVGMTTMMCHIFETTRETAKGYLSCQLNTTVPSQAQRRNKKNKVKVE